MVGGSYFPPSSVIFVHTQKSERFTYRNQTCNSDQVFAAVILITFFKEMGNILSEWRLRYLLDK